MPRLPADRVRAERVATACRNCRFRKVRCNVLFASSSAASFLTSSVGSGANPCRDCIRLDKECIYPPLQRRRKRARDSHISDTMEDRLARMEATLQGARISARGRDSQNLPRMDSENTASQRDASSYTALEDEYEQRYPTSGNARNPNLRRRVSNSPAPGSQDSGSRIVSLMGVQAARSAREPRLSSNISTSDSIVNDEDDSRHDLHAINREYQEPWSLMAVCSQDGLNWVCGKTRTRDFVNISERFARSSTRLPLGNSYMSLSSRSLEIDEVTAWEYVNGE